MSFNGKFIDDQVNFHEPHDIYSFLQGFLAGAEAFAIWKDGEQYLGSGFNTVKTLKAAIEEYEKDQE